MSEATPTTTETTEVPADPAPKAKKTKTPAKTLTALTKNLKAVGSKKKKKTPGKPPTSASGLSIGDRKVSVIKSLQKLGATKSGTAASIDRIAEKSGLDRRTVYGTVNGLTGKAGSDPRCLTTTGHVKVVLHEGVGLAAYLTATGQKADFSTPPFVSGRIGG